MNTLARLLLIQGDTGPTVPAAASWTVQLLPDALLQSGPFGVQWWQLLAVLPVVAIAVVAGALASWVLTRAIGAVARRTNATWDDILLARLRTPALVACSIAAITVLLPVVALPPRVSAAAYQWIRVAFGVVLFWSAWRLVDIARQVTAGSHWATTVPASRSLIPLGARVFKVGIGALGLVVVLSMLGYPVASLVAGLGLGGLAFALAAQKTVENLFGAFSIGVDQPFREGDFVKVDDFVGTVEAIGLRSTRFRTLDRTIVTLPNGRLADMRLESFAVRDRLRLAAVVGLVYETTRGQLRELLAGFERVLRAQPKIWPDAVVVRFSAFGASSLDVEVMAWFQTSDWSEFQRIREQVLLEFMTVVEAAGSAFAVPARTIRLTGLPAVEAGSQLGVSS
jgi:MscS family membrane protein